jgi:hypothetical protein
MSSTSSSPLGAARSHDATVLAAALAFVAELILAVATWADVLSLGVALVGHVAVCVVLGLWFRRRVTDDVLMPGFLMLVVALSGPIGAAGMLLLAGRMTRRRPDTTLLAAWYDRIAHATELDQTARLAGAIGNGRAVDARASLPGSFATLLQSGAIGEQQTALGIIARNFDPEYLPALKSALASSKPVIRVQAAAVAARLRPEIKARVARAIEGSGSMCSEPADVPRAMRHVAVLRRYLESGLLEIADQSAAEAALVRVRAGIAAVLGGTQPLATLDHVLADDLERDFLEARDFEAFRRLRAAQRVRRVGRHRLRQIARPVPRRRVRGILAVPSFARGR